jgi:hypothetical protein
MACVPADLERSKRLNTPWGLHLCLNRPVSGWRQGFIAKAVALTVAGAAQAQPSCDMFPCFPFNFPNAILNPEGAYLFASKAPVLARMLHHGVFGKLNAWQLVRVKARPESCCIHNLPPHFVLVFSAFSFMAL